MQIHYKTVRMFFEGTQMCFGITRVIFKSTQIYLETMFLMYENFVLLSQCQKCHRRGVDYG